MPKIFCKRSEKFHNYYMRFKDFISQTDTIDEGMRLPAGRDLLKSIPLTAALLGGNYFAGDPIGQQMKSYIAKNSEEITDQDIVASVKVVPKDLIRASQFDKNKWDVDYANLKKPLQNDIGFATHKNLMDVPATLHVVKHAAMVGNDQFKYVRAGFATPSTLEIFLSDRLFKELPSGGNIGKLTPIGQNVLAHELRHLTQNYQATSDRTKHRNDKTTDMVDYHNYMNDPLELGVRLAAIKNFLSKPTLKQIAYSLNDNRSKLDLAIQTLPDDEKQMLVFIFNPRKWAKAMVEQRRQMGFDDILLEDEYFKLANKITSKMGELNGDVNQLLQHYKNVPKQKQFLDELLQHYDQVVNTYRPNKYKLT